MQSSYNRPRRNSCNRDNSGYIAFLPIFIVLAVILRWSFIWPLFIIFLILMFSNKSKHNSLSNYQPKDSTYLNTNNINQNLNNSEFKVNFCKNCGSPTEPDSTFCSECGNRLNY